jgi:hypothetical protein
MKQEEEEEVVEQAAADPLQAAVEAVKVNGAGDNTMDHR